MQAETMNCPMCGAPAATDATLCEHCGARLATVACPSCFGLIFQGAEFCSHCGAKVERTEVATGTTSQCPHCHVPLGAVTVGTTGLLECAKCEGLWVDNATFEQICQDRDKQAAVLGLPGSQPASEFVELEAIHYVPCPVCHSLMNRVNFAHCSHVIINVCTKHGTWFEKDELRKIIEFIRAGGLEKSREREIEELDYKRSLERVDRSAAAVSLPDMSDSPPQRYDGYSRRCHWRGIGSLPKKVISRVSGYFHPNP
jgi:Zn-finger nucleic acid-binding protein